MIKKIITKIAELPFRIKLNKRLNNIRQIHVESLPEKSFARKFQEPFSSRKDMSKERALIRFKEDKSKSVIDISKRRKKYSTDIDATLVNNILKHYKYNLKESTFIHQHPNAESNICRPSSSDLCVFAEEYLVNKIYKFQVSYMDDYNIKEIGRTYLQVNKDKQSIDKLGECLIRLKKLRTDLNLIKLANFNYTILEKNKEAEIERTYALMIKCFFVKQIGLNGYKYNPEFRAFVK